jgi:hypothetical protein
MKKPQAPGLSDSTLSALWRKVVLHVGRNTCVICGGGGYLECHHIIKRRYKLLLWNWRNGVPVHKGDCHATADRLGMSAAGPAWYSYLLEMAKWTKKEYLMKNDWSESEWRAGVKNDLSAELGGGA